MLFLFRSCEYCIAQRLCLANALAPHADKLCCNREGNLFRRFSADGNADRCADIRQPLRRYPLLCQQLKNKAHPAAAADEPDIGCFMR